MIEFPESHKYLAGDYMRENPMYSAREVRELIAAEREACAKVCETEAAFAGSNGKKDASALNCADAIRMRSNNQVQAAPCKQGTAPATPGYAGDHKGE